MMVLPTFQNSILLFEVVPHVHFSILVLFQCIEKPQAGVLGFSEMLLIQNGFLHF